MIKASTKGDFHNVEAFFQRVKSRSYLKRLERFGAQGVSALKAATPEESGETANRWTYEIIDRPGYFSIQWLNTHVEDPGHIPIAVLIQYGHGTRTGGFVQGVDYINPALRAIFNQIAADMWREVTK